jgi:hypothetical protein
MRYLPSPAARAAKQQPEGHLKGSGHPAADNG